MMKKDHCPECGKYCIYTIENPYRPFCCERCKTIDLGAWATESYRIPLQDQEGYDDNAIITESDV